MNWLKEFFISLQFMPLAIAKIARYIFMALSSAALNQSCYTFPIGYKISTAIQRLSILNSAYLLICSLQESLVISIFSPNNENSQ